MWQSYFRSNVNKYTIDHETFVSRVYDWLALIPTDNHMLERGSFTKPTPYRSHCKRLFSTLWSATISRAVHNPNSETPQDLTHKAILFIHYRTINNYQPQAMNAKRQFPFLPCYQIIQPCELLYGAVSENDDHTRASRTYFPCTEY